MKIVWLSTAVADLKGIHEYFGKSAGKETADRVLQRIFRAAQILSSQPFAGRPSEKADGVHELAISGTPYVLPYRVKAGRVEILRAFDARRRPTES